MQPHQYINPVSHAYTHTRTHAGGVLVITGAAFSANIGVGIECGTGSFIALGGGTLTVTGTTQALVAGVDFWAGAGVHNWIGAGSGVFTAFSESRTVGVAAVYGASCLRMCLCVEPRDDL